MICESRISERKMKMNVAILGAAGRMGQMLVKLAEADPSMTVVAKVMWRTGMTPHGRPERMP